jgi:release factor glutamine methyltransferase
MHEESITIKEALKKASLRLKNQKEAAILLASHLGKDQLYLIAHDDETVEDPTAYEALVTRRLENEPIEYITQRVSFYSETFFIRKGALIPRPETELLVDKAAQIIRTKKIKSIAEIGTGSGIIAVMLAQLFPNVKITATDINEEALQIAKINADHFKVSDRISFIRTSCLDDLNRDFDMIISNPPYIQEGVVLEAPLGFEPQNALYGGKSGDEILRCIIDLAIDRSVSFLACEMGYDQREALAAYMQHKGIGNVSFYKDYSGFDRGFVAKIKE